MLRRALLGLVIFCAACESAPTSPHAGITLALSHTSAQLTRNGTLSLTVRLSSRSGASDVTATAEWSSSNPAVLTVDRGTLSGVGPGAATVTASYRGRSITLPVSVRRNTAIGGVVAMRETTGRRPFGSLQVLLDGQVLGGRGGSDHSGSERQEARYGWIAGSSLRAHSQVGPGSVTLMVRPAVDWQFSGSHTLVTEGLSYVEVFDTDTGESLDRVILPQREVTIVPAVSHFALVPVAITIKAYTE